MGSIEINPEKQNKRANTLCCAEFHDEDQSAINVAVAINDEGQLHEIDIWKYDFGPVQRYPSNETFLRYLPKAERINRNKRPDRR